MIERGTLPEPEPFRRGKAFERRIRKVWSTTLEDDDPQYRFEVNIKHLKVRGRADIVIYGDNDFRAVLEIKSTDWDRIKPKNVTRNLWRHQRQLFRYIDKFLEADNLSVSPGIVYPKPPKELIRRNRIEGYLEERGIPIYWFSEIE